MTVQTLRTLAGLMVLAEALMAQENATLRRARAASEGLDFTAAVRLARQAEGERLSREDRVEVFELLGYAYGALDSTRQAVDAFRQLIFLAPDREPDVERVSPRITSLYASALGQVLVVRKLTVDSADFVAGDGRVLIRYQVSRAARTTTRVVGQGLDVVVDSQVVTGPGLAAWNGLTPSGEAAPAGAYQVLVTAAEGRNEFTGPAELRVDRGTVDTVEHLSALPGYTFLAETESPPRNWRPLGLAVLYAGIVTGATVALENTGLDLGERREVAGVGTLAFVTGLVMSLKKPDPRPVPANIQYNALLREQIAERNRLIGQENQRRRQQVRLKVIPVVGGAAR